MSPIPKQQNRPLTIAKALILGGSVAAIVVAFPVIAQYTGLTVDITRTPQRLGIVEQRITNDEIGNYQFQTNVLAQLQHQTWVLEKIEREQQLAPFPVKDQSK